MNTWQKETKLNSLHHTTLHFSHKSSHFSFVQTVFFGQSVTEECVTGHECVKWFQTAGKCKYYCTFQIQNNCQLSINFHLYYMDILHICYTDNDWAEGTALSASHENRKIERSQRRSLIAKFQLPPFSQTFPLPWWRGEGVSSLQLNPRGWSDGWSWREDKPLFSVITWFKLTPFCQR